MTLAVCSKDVKFFRWPNITYGGVFETPADCMSIKGICWSSNGKELLLVKSKGNPVIISPPTKPEQYIEPFDCIHINNASVATFCNKNHDMLALATEHGSVYLYDTKLRQKLPHDFKRLPCGIQNLEFSCDDLCIAAGCLSGQIFLYDSNFKPCASFFIPNSPTLSTMAYSKYTPNLLAGGSKEGVLAAWDTDTTDVLFWSRNHSNRITDISFFDNILSTVGIDGNFVSYDMRSRSISASYKLDCPLSSLAYLPCSYEMAISTVSGQLRSYDSRNMNNPLRTHVAGSSGGIKKIAFPNVKDEILTTSAFFPKGGQKHNNCYDDNCSASGDFSIITDSTNACDGKNADTTPEGDEDDIPESDSVMVIAPPKVRSHDVDHLVKALEERMKSNSKEFEEKLLQTFYALRISTSKNFIGLEEKISQSWNSFVDYLKLSGAASVTSVNSTVKSMGRDALTQNQCYSSIRDDI